MSETITGAAAPRRWQLRRRPAPEARVTFADLARAHYEREAAAAQGGETARHAREHYARTRRAFERCAGRLVEEYWCATVASGAALTVQRPWFAPMLKKLRFHRASDWATPSQHRIASAIHDVDELAVKVSEVLLGTGQRICMGLLFRSAGNLLSLVDETSRHADDRQTAELLRHESAKVEETKTYYEETARRQAQLVYVLGMALAVVVFGLANAGILWLFSWQTDATWGVGGAQVGDEVSLGLLMVASTAGSLGAVVSVVQRVSSNRFALDFDVGRGVLLFLGAFRPFLGSISAIAVYLAFVSGLAGVLKVPEDETAAFYFFAVVSFLAGFSERWAKDVLLGVTKEAPDASAGTGGAS
jgi:hypothetical protein